MYGMILCPQHIGGLEAITKDTPAAAINLCGKTLLARLLDKFIALGVTKAFVVSEQTDKSIDRLVKNYEHRDKITVEVAQTAQPLMYDIANEYLICDVVACTNADIAELSNDLAVNTALTDENGSLVMVKLGKDHIKQFALSDVTSLFTQVADCCKQFGKKTVKVKIPANIGDLLNCQAEILDKDAGGVTSLTDSNFNGVTVIPPAYIGKNVVIKSGAVVGQGTVIGDNARIGSNASVLGSFVGDGAIVGKNCSLNKAYVCQNAVLMNRVRLSAGAAVKGSVCVKSNTLVGENFTVSPDDEHFRHSAFDRGEKPLELDDDGICSLYDGTTDVSSYTRLGKALGTSVDIGKSVVVGVGLEINTDVLVKALSCGVCSCGVNVLDIGECTLPQLGYAVARTGSQLGVYVGVDANGDIRLVQQGGLPLVTRLEETIVTAYEQNRFRSAALSDYGEIASAESEKNAYFAMLDSILPASLKGLCVNVRTNDRYAAQLCEKLFCPANDLDGERIVFQLSSDLTTLNAYSDETGNVRWEQLCLLCCKIMFESGKPVSLPYSIPMSAERLAQRLQGTVYRYCTVNVDESDVNARETACQPLGSFLRDALLLAVMICRYLNDKQISLKTALDDIEPVCCTQRYLCGCAEKPFALENAQVVGCEGVRVSDEHTTAFVRPSKNRRSLMIYAESTSSEFASSFCDELSEKLRNHAVLDNDS